MFKTVEIIKVEKQPERPKRDGGTYAAVVVMYRDNGELKEKAFAASYLKENLAMREQLKSLKEGVSVDIDLQKNAAGFWNIVAFKPAGTGVSTTTTTRGGGKTFVDNSVGMQVGNALTNASNLIASGKTKKGDTLKDVAEYVLTLGEELKANHAAGKYAYTAEPTKTDSTTDDLTDVFEDEEIDF